MQWGRYRLEVSTGDRNGPLTSVDFDAGWYAEASADTPDLLEIALDKPEYAAGDTMTVAVTARTAGKRHAQRDRRPPADDGHAGREGRHRRSCAFRSATTGAPAPMWSRRLRRPLDAAAKRMPGRAIGVQWFSIDRKARTLAHRHDAAAR